MESLLSNLKLPRGARKKVKRVGRGPGSGHGKTACRGENGYGKRSGSKDLAGFEGGQMPLHRRLPKRGFTNIFKQVFTLIHIADLERWGLAVVNPEVLAGKGLGGKVRPVWIKLLGDGEATRAYKVTVHKASKQAVGKIEKAGGKVTLIEPKPAVKEKEKEKETQAQA